MSHSAPPWPQGSGRRDLGALCLKTCLCLFSPALRSPLSLPSPFAASFSLGSHSALNGDLAVPSSYVSLHLSPQVSGSVVYGRSPMVSPQGGRRLQGPRAGGWEGKPVTQRKMRSWGEEGGLA